MDTLSMFIFLYIFCYFLLLLSAAAASEECSKGKALCGYLGEITFPFTTIDKPECGFYISGCDNNYSSVKKIKFRNQTYEINSINYMFNSITPIIYGTSSSQFGSKSILNNIPALSINNITFFGCNYGYDNSHKNMSKYRSCSGYDLYFTSKLDNPTVLDFPLACLPVEVVTELSGYRPNDCAELISILEIKVDLEFCQHCYYSGRSCLLNQETLNFTCVPDFGHVAVAPKLHIEEQSNNQTKRTEQNLKVAVIGLSVTLATVLFVMILFLYYWRIKNQSRTNYGDLSRNTTIPESSAVYFGIPVFSYEELKDATNNFDKARELGEGGFGTVYYGKLRDGREVAVKRLFERNYRPVESFTNEIQILTHMRHRNLVSLYGCTSRHSRELLLVYEYVPNDTVSSHIHSEIAKHNSTLPWTVRMKIAVETASALTYLHASDIIHRDVKTSNILLDNSFCVKVADFGLSRLYPNDVTHVSTAPKGTPGYVDPEYQLCYQLTNKSDVYSYGVVLMELISSLPAVDFARDRDDIKLANLAIRKIQRRETCDLIDPSLGFQTDERLKKVITSVAELAFKCLQEEKELRPSMWEVLEELQRIERAKNERENNDEFDFHHGVGVAQSYAHPSLPNTWVKPQQHQRTL